MARRKFRLVVPIISVLIGIYLLIGCIPIPATRQLQPDLSYRPEHYVGTEEDKPVRLGYTHIDDAWVYLSQRVKPYNGGPNFFGAPARISYSPEWVVSLWSVSSDRRRWSMSYSIRTATWIAPLCFTAWAETAQRWITFDVDENGIITRTTTTDQPLVAQVDSTRWLEVFDVDTRRKLYDAGVLPSDAALRQSPNRIYEYRPAPPSPTDINRASEPQLLHRDVHWKPADTRPTAP